MGARWWSSGLVIMGRALDAGSPFHDNGFSNRPIGGAPARSGQVIMGRAVGSGSPVRPGRTNRVVGGCRVIMGRALKVGSPLRGNGFSNRPIGHAPAGSDRVCMAAARSAGSPRCAVAPGLDRWARASAERPGDHGACGRAWMPGEVRGAEGAFRRVPGDHGACARGPDTRYAATDSRICGGQVLMGRAADSARRGRVRGRVSAGRAS